MTFRGTRSGARYRNFAIALALFASMLVVFAFTFIASTTRLHADTTVNNIDTWEKLEKAVEDAENESGLTTIKITDDLVATSQIAIKSGNKIKIASDSNKAIYRERGNTNFSVFKVNGELELADNVHMSGDTADVTSSGRNLIIKDGVGNVIISHDLKKSKQTTLKDVFYYDLKLMLFDGDAAIFFDRDAWNAKLKETLVDNPKYRPNPKTIGYVFNEDKPWTWPSGLDRNASLNSIQGNVTIVANWKRPETSPNLPSYTITDTAGVASNNTVGGKIDRTKGENGVFKNVHYTKKSENTTSGSYSTNTSANRVEHFASGSATEGKGFFIDVEQGGTAKINGAELKDFRSVGYLSGTDSNNAPEYVAPVSSKGTFEMAAGNVKNIKQKGSNSAAVVIANAGTPKITGGTISDNVLEGANSVVGIANRGNGTALIGKATFTENTVAGASSAVGIRNFGSGEAQIAVNMNTNAPTFTKNIVSGNNSAVGIQNTGSGEAKIAGSTVIGGTAENKNTITGTNSAAGIYTSGGKGFLQGGAGVTISHNDITNTGSAAGIVATGSANAEIKDNITISNNKLTKGNSAAGINSASGDASITSSNVTISNNTIGSNGNDTYSAAGIRSTGGTSTISAGTITNNTVNGRDSAAGIYSESGTAKITGGTISKNTLSVNAQAAGITARAGSARIEGGTISENNLSGRDSAAGIFAWTSSSFNDVKITNGTIQKNVMNGPSSAAGIWTNIASAAIEGGTISENQLKNSSSAAGIVVTQNGGSATISGGTIKKNTMEGVNSAAGICTWGANATINGSAVIGGDNSDDGNNIKGGWSAIGIYAGVGSKVTATIDGNANIGHNKATDRNRTAGVLIDNRVVDNVVNIKGNANIHHNTLKGNGSAAGVSIETGSAAITMSENSKIQNNVLTGSNSAGAFNVGTDNSSLKLSGNAKIKDNDAAYTTHNDQPYVDESKRASRGQDNWNDTMSKGGWGVGGTGSAGAVILHTNSTDNTILGNVEISGNKGNTGAIMITKGTLKQGLATAPGSKGDDRNDKDSTIKGNTGFKKAGAVDITGPNSKYILVGGSLEENTSWLKGGAVAIRNNGKFQFGYGEPTKNSNNEITGITNLSNSSNARIENNVAMYHGGGIYVESDHTELYSGTIAGNTARIMGGGIYVDGEASNGNIIRIYSGNVYHNQATWGMRSKDKNGSILTYKAGDNAQYTTQGGAERGYDGQSNEGDKNGLRTRNVFTGNDSKGIAYSGKTRDFTYTSDGGVKDFNQYRVGDEMTNDNTYHMARTNGLDENNYNFHSGTGGGLWLCPWGTSALGMETVSVFNNDAAYTGNDLHKDSARGGAVILEDSFDDLSAQGGRYWTYDNRTIAGDLAVTSESPATGTKLAPNPNEAVYRGLNLQSHDVTPQSFNTGMQIYENASRRGGGIGADGTVIFGKGKKAYRVQDAFLKFNKTWTQQLASVKKNVLMEVAVEIPYEAYKNGTDGETVTKIHRQSIDMLYMGDGVRLEPLTGESLAAEYNKHDNKPYIVYDWSAVVGIPATVTLPNDAKATEKKINLYTISGTKGSGAISTGWKLAFRELQYNLEGETAIPKVDSEGKYIEETAFRAFSVDEMTKKDEVHKTLSNGGTDVHFDTLVIGGKDDNSYTVQNNKEIEVPATKKWKDRNNELILTKKPNGITIPNVGANDYFNWAEKDAEYIHLQLQGKNDNKQYKQKIYAEDIKDLYRNALREQRTSASVYFQEADNVEERYIGIKDDSGNTAAKISLKKETINGKNVYTPWVTYIVRKYDTAGNEINYTDKICLTELGIGRENGGHGKYDRIQSTFTIDDGSNGQKTVLCMTNKDTAIEVPALKNWLDANGMVMLTKKPNGVTWSENNLGNITENGESYERYINWPATGADKYAINLKGGTPANRKYEISLDDIKPLLTGNGSDIEQSETKKFNAGANVVDRSVEWTDNRGNAKLTLDMQLYRVIYDKNGEVVYAESASKVDENRGSKTIAEYMRDKAIAELKARGRTQTEAEALIPVADSTPYGFNNKGKNTYIYFPKLTYVVDSRNSDGATITYTLEEDNIADYAESVTGNQNSGFKVANRYEKIEIPVTKEWYDYNGNIIMTQDVTLNPGNPSSKKEFKDKDGNKVWVNWPATWANYLTVSLNDENGFIKNDELHSAKDENTVSIQSALKGGRNSWIANGIKTAIEFDEREYYIVQEKNTDKVILTMLASEVDANRGNKAAGEYLIPLAVQKSGKEASKLELADNGKARKVCFPKLVYTLDKYDSQGNLKTYVVKEVNVQGNPENYNEYAASYSDANGNKIDVNANITDRAKHQAMMTDGVIIHNDRNVNIRVTKKWSDGASEISWPEGVDKVRFTLLWLDQTESISNAEKDKDGKPIKWINEDGSVSNQYYVQYKVVEGAEVKELTKGAFNSETKYVEWTNLPKYSNAFGNASKPHDQLIKTRYYVREETPDGYKSVIPVEYEELSGDKNSETFEFTAKNTKLTKVEATKTWKDNNGPMAWTDAMKAKLYLMRELKVDHFGKDVKQKDLTKGGNPYITVSGSNIDVEQINGDYGVRYNNKTYAVKEDAFVEIDNVIYAIQSGVNKETDEKVLINPKDKNGAEIIAAKEANINTKTVKWDELPYYDAEMPSGLSDSEKETWKTNHKIHYWIKEEPIQNYSSSVTLNSDTSEKKTFTVENDKTDSYKTNVSARKVWNDGGNASARPKIKFQLWKAERYQTYNGGEYIFHNGSPWKHAGKEDKVIGAAGSQLEVDWKDLPVKGEYNRRATYIVYCAREMVRVGWADEAKTIEIYAYTDDWAYGDSEWYPPSESKVDINVTGPDSEGKYTVTSQGKHQTFGTVPENKKVAVFDTNAMTQINGKWQSVYKARVDYTRQSFKDGYQDICGAYNAVAYNSKPAIEKYVNKDVHKNLATKDEVFTYDIMAYAPNGSTRLIIKDPLIKALEFVDKDGDKQSDDGFDKDKLVTVAYMDENDHKAISMNTDGSVTKDGTVLSSGYTVDISRKPTTTLNPKASDYKTKLENYINLSETGNNPGYENRLTVTLPTDAVNTILDGSGENGRWVKVTFKAKIREDIDFTGLKTEQMKKLGFETITKNDPVETTIATHSGFKNDASYDVKLKNEHEFTNVPSNTVTVVPPSAITVKKKVTGTLGDLTKEFEFEVSLTGLKAGTRYHYDQPRSKSGIKVYNAQGALTYDDGFNADSDGTKFLVVKLKANQKIAFIDLPIGAKYKITERASDHQPSYRLEDKGILVEETSREITAADVTDGCLVKEDGKWIKATTEMIGQTKTVATNVRAKDNNGKGEALGTATETVDAGEKVTITYTNHRDIETETGIIKDTWPWNIILLIVLVLLAYDDQMRKIKNRLRIHRISQV